MAIDEKRYYKNLDKLNDEIYFLGKQVLKLTKEIQILKNEFMKLESNGNDLYRSGRICELHRTGR